MYKFILFDDTFFKKVKIKMYNNNKKKLKSY